MEVEGPTKKQSLYDMGPSENTQNINIKHNKRTDVNWHQNDWEEEKERKGKEKKIEEKREKKEGTTACAIVDASNLDFIM